MSKKTAFITGGAGGLGSSTSHYLAERGWQVFAADFDEKALASLEGTANITGVPINVMDTASVEAAANSVKEQVDGLDAIINFAGILAVGSVIELDEAVMQRVLDVNVMGTFRVNQALFPMVHARHGRIINVSSETGWQSGGPFNGAYASSKHAIEAYSDSLRRELMFLDIPVIKIQPGPFKTEMVAGIEGNFNRAVEASTHFKPVLSKIKDLAMRESKKGHDPRYLASVVHQALTVKSPKAAYSIKPDPLRTMLEYIPASWADALLKKVLSGG